MHWIPCLAGTVLLLLSLCRLLQDQLLLAAVHVRLLTPEQVASGQVNQQWRPFGFGGLHSIVWCGLWHGVLESEQISEYDLGTQAREKLLLLLRVSVGHVEEVPLVAGALLRHRHHMHSLDILCLWLAVLLEVHETVQLCRGEALLLILAYPEPPLGGRDHSLRVPV